MLFLKAKGDHMCVWLVLKKAKRCWEGVAQSVTHWIPNLELGGLIPSCGEW